MENNEVLAPVADEQVTVNQVVDAVTEDDGLDTGHKIGFYIILGLIGLSGVGIPILAFLLVKEHKKRKQLEDTLNGKTAETPAPAATEEPKAEADAPEAKAEEPAPEKKKK